MNSTEVKELDIVSEDDRRILGEFGAGGKWKVAKYVKVKEECVIGNHLHKKKDELFIFLQGSVEIQLDGLHSSFRIYPEVDLPLVVNVPRGVKHSFRCAADTVIIGLCSDLHDDRDDYHY